MEKLLLLCLISYAVLQENGGLYTGPAYNVKQAQTNSYCVDYFPYDDDYETWYDDVVTDQNEIPYSASECVDTLPWDYWEQRYYDRCCYVRLQIDGKMHGGCLALTEEQYLDIAETIRRLEDGDPMIISRATKNSKVYQLDCKSNYLKALTIASILLSLIF